MCGSRRDNTKFAGLVNMATSPNGVRQRRLFTGRPWQVVTINLVGLMPSSLRGNSFGAYRSLYTVADALAIPDALAPTVTQVLDQHVFGYSGLPEKIHTDEGA